MQGQYLVGGFVRAICAVAQFGMSAAAFFAGVAGELDAVDGEHVAPNQALSITGHTDLAEQGFDCPPRPHTNLAMWVWLGWLSPLMAMNWTLSAQAWLNGAAGDQALAVGEQDYLEHDAGVIGTGTDFIVLELGV